jgi:hypothetical protein
MTPAKVDLIFEFNMKKKTHSCLRWLTFDFCVYSDVFSDRRSFLNSNRDAENNMFKKRNANTNQTNKPNKPDKQTNKPAHLVLEVDRVFASANDSLDGPI